MLDIVPRKAPPPSLSHTHTHTHTYTNTHACVNTHWNQVWNQTSIRKEIININVRINYIGNRNKIEKINETKIVTLKHQKHWQSLEWISKEKTERHNYYIWNEKSDIIVYNVLKYNTEYCEEVYAHIDNFSVTLRSSLWWIHPWKT